ncbi:membrane-spanning 4-domains subfamily A member 13 [Rhynchocyon petersi]
MIGIFHVFMWYFVLTLYLGQLHGVFGVYEPVTYKTGTSLWGIVVTCTLLMNILASLVAVAGVVLTVYELSRFHSVSYKNYGQAKLGREVSRVLLFSYHLEVAVAMVYSVFCCAHLSLLAQQSPRPPRRQLSTWVPSRPAPQPQSRR